MLRETDRSSCVDLPRRPAVKHRSVPSRRSTADVLDQEVHVWLVFEERWSGAIDRDGFVLSADEMATANAFPNEALRTRYRIAHCALRKVLSSYDDTPPQAWVFRRGRWGRPELMDGDTGLRFSVSYGDGMTAIAVACDAEVGVDIVSTRRNVDVFGIAEHAFAPSELADLRSIESGAARQRFFDYWALKEAYAKALGTGFWKNPRDFAFSFPAHGEIGFRDRVRRRKTKWQFLLALAPLDHRLAVGARTRRPRRIVAKVAASGEPCRLTVTRQYARDLAILCQKSIPDQE